MNFILTYRFVLAIPEIEESLVDSDYDHWTWQQKTFDNLFDAQECVRECPYRKEDVDVSVQVLDPNSVDVWDELFRMDGQALLQRRTVE